MTFGAITVLFALPLAALPLLFHLLMKRRQRELPFSTFLFFLKADPHMASRRRLKELLLLALRILFILCLVLALSRPRAACRTAMGNPLAVAILIDNSASMSAEGRPGKSKLRLAREAAQRIVDALPVDAVAAICLLVDDPAANLPAGLSGRRAELAAALSSIQPTDAGGSPGRAVRRALNALDAAPPRASGRTALYILSDFQRAEWSDATFENDIADLPRPPVLYHVPTHNPSPANITIDAVELPRQLPLPGRPYPVAVRLRNTSDVPLIPRIETRDSRRNETVRQCAIPANSVRTETWTIKPPSAGVHWLHVAFEGDDFVADNEVFIGLRCRTPAPVLLAGTRAGFGLLPEAFSPAGDGRFTGLRPVFCPASALAATLQEVEPLLLVRTWGSMASTARATPGADATEAFVRNGGRLLLVPASQALEPTREVPDWIGGALRLPRRHGDVFIEVLDRRHPLWQPLLDDSGGPTLEGFHAKRHFALDLAPPFRALLGTGFADPVLAERRVDDGFVYVSGLAFSPTWTSLMTHPAGAGMLLLHQMALHGQDESSAFVAVEAGQPLASHPAVGQALDVIPVAGDRLEQTLAANDVPVFPRAGVFSIEAPGASYGVWVQPSPREGSAPFLSTDDVGAMRPEGAHVVSLAADLEELPEHAAADRTVALFLPLLLAAMCAWVAEGWVETSGRRRKPGASPRKRGAA